MKEMKEQKCISRRDFMKLATVLSGGMLVTLTGCAPATEPPAVEEPEEAPEEEAPTQEPAPAEEYELRFIKLAMGEAVQEYFEETAIPTFEADYPGCTITVDMSDWDHLGEKLLTSFAGNIPVDMLETGSDWVGPYAKRGQFLPLDDYVGAPEYQADMEDFYADMVDISRFQGKLMAMPYILDIRTMCYRKDFFEEVGLDPEVPPDTWDDLVEYATKLVQTDDDGNITRSGYAANVADPTGAMFEFWYRLVQNGSGVIVPWGSWDANDVQFNGPEGVEALRFVYDMFHVHKIAPLGGMSDMMPNLSALGQGITTMSVQGSWEIGNWTQYQPDKIDFLGIGVPLMKKKRVQYACPNVYAIGVNTKTPDRSWELMTHTISTEIMTGMLGAETQSPPRTSIAADAEYMQDPLLQLYQQIPEKGWGATTPQAVEWPTLMIIGNYVQAAVRDELSIQEALDKAAEEVKQKITELE